MFSPSQRVIIAFFFFWQTSLTGTIPTELGQFSSPDFWALFLEDNLMTGTIPSEIFTCAGAGLEISLSDAGFTGTIPSEIGTCVNHSKFPCI